MKLRSLFIPLLASTLYFGCAAPVDDDIASDSAELVTLSPAELAATKASIRSIANANIDRTDNWTQVRAQLDPLVAKLERHFGRRSAARKLPLVKGAWRQIWSDFPYPMGPVTTMDPRQIYQVVSADGYYYNIGDQKAFGLFGLTGVLRGAYTLDNTRLRIEFTKVGFRFGRLGRTTDLVGLATQLEAGERFYLGLPGGGKAPNGPVGIRGTLETIYVDADLRIERGTQEDYLDASGNVATPGVPLPKFFILDRVTVPVK